MIGVYPHRALGRAAALAVAVMCLGAACNAPQQTAERSATRPTTTQSVAGVNQQDIETVIKNYFSAYNNADIDGMSRVSFGYVLAGIQDKGEAYQKDIVENLAKKGKVTILGYSEFSSQKDIRASIVVSARRDKVLANFELRFNMVRLKNDWRVNQIEEL
ncbi:MULTISPECIES: hypothetical protein [Mycolicibacterium]|jgi:hypothetical protein|uniref:hypothetical protein n=1 Tax=Mycolicibacterium TaxID=1866885 RepID=UPI000FA15846|nr:MULTISPECIES: hypothetical protein [Mycolicibacterium]RUP29032.1 MAG: hypothetical protein EKK51_21530 [Mycolicibacterium sp.]UCZ58785.1 hypothetical protein LHJ73_18635 [Mycolicibacterium phocaicum]